jgi:hypothetical protein
LLSADLRKVDGHAESTTSTLLMSLKRRCSDWCPVDATADYVAPSPILQYISGEEVFKSRRRRGRDDEEVADPGPEGACISSVVG